MRPAYTLLLGLGANFFSQGTSVMARGEGERERERRTLKRCKTPIINVAWEGTYRLILHIDCRLHWLQCTAYKVHAMMHQHRHCRCRNMFAQLIGHLDAVVPWQIWFIGDAMESITPVANLSLHVCKVLCGRVVESQVSVESGPCTCEMMWIHLNTFDTSFVSLLDSAVLSSSNKLYNFNVSYNLYRLTSCTYFLYVYHYSSNKQIFLSTQIRLCSATIPKRLEYKM